MVSSGLLKQTNKQTNKQKRQKKNVSERSNCDLCCRGQGLSKTSPHKRSIALLVTIEHSDLLTGIIETSSNRGLESTFKCLPLEWTLKIIVTKV